MAKRVKFQPPDDLMLLWAFHAAGPEFERNSYFDLADNARQIADALEKPVGRLPRIEGWSFVPHPAVIDHLTGERLTRYIVAIDTMSDSVYWPVRSFLERQDHNVRSYFSGGMADFLVDVQMEEIHFKAFLRDLDQILIDNGIQNFSSTLQAVSAFQVVRPLLLCGKPISEYGKPSSAILRELAREREKFEAAFRNYRSPACTDLFKNSKESLRAYLRRLTREQVILCFRPTIDLPSFLARDYIPMSIGSPRERPIENLLAAAADDEQLLRPVIELLRVRQYRVGDSAEEGVNYFFVNEYELPHQRVQWKTAIYHVYEDANDVNVNLYNYPLEQILNDSPIYLSDVPEILARVRQYDGAGDALHVGWLAHAQISEKYPVSLPISGLGGHGLTLGDPGTRKTSGDVVLVTEAARFLTHIVILDSSKSIAEKLELLKPAVRDRLQIKIMSPGDDEVALSRHGVSVIECERGELQPLFDTISGALEKQMGVTGGKPRAVTTLLLVEEAGQLFSGPDAVARTQRMIDFLKLAWRKGTCVWLSAHYPSTLGYDLASAKSVIGHLKNWLVYRIKDRPEDLELLTTALEQQRASSAEVSLLARDIGTIADGHTHCQGMRRNGTEERLPLVTTKMKLLEEIT
jgi:hypothetical protein